MVLLKKTFDETTRRDVMSRYSLENLSLLSQRLNVYECLTGSNVLQRFACSSKRLSIYEAHACVSTFQNRI